MRDSNSQNKIQNIKIDNELEKSISQSEIQDIELIVRNL